MRAALRALVARPALLYAGTAVLSALAYIGFSAAGGYIGFPLDDAWIHQTYARNLAALGEMAFIPGQPSAGSTSPLWTWLLAMGYLVHLDYHVWTYLLGAALLALDAWLVYRLVRRYWPSSQPAALAAGLLVIFEWHLAWSAVSGMETLLFCAGVLLVFVLDWPAQAGLIGLVAGLAVLARPDGLSLLPFVALRATLAQQRSWRSVAWAGLGFALLFIPYLALNYRLSGTPWPNTFYAKQAEYAILRQQPLWSRLLMEGGLPLIGVLVLLVPAIIVAGWSAARARHWEPLLALGWVLSLTAAYALRLPVNYQYGRYVMPVIPVLVALGIGGLAQIVRPGWARMVVRVGSRAWLLSVVVLAAAFWAIGAIRYRTDVRFIQTEMVASAQWVAGNTPAGSIVAAHDIGALGFFGDRPILDMAGLVSPEVIPFIRDESGLKTWLDARGANYLMTFPKWYPTLTAPLERLKRFDTNAPDPEEGENMVVYSWPGRS